MQIYKYIPLSKKISHIEIVKFVTLILIYGCSELENRKKHVEKYLFLLIKTLFCKVSKYEIYLYLYFLLKDSYI